MSTGIFLLFFAGLILSWIIATIIGRRLTEGDRFEEETVNERLAHLEQRLYTHRKWWQTGIVVGVLACYVMVVGMFFTQNIATEVERESKRREAQAEEQRIENQCRFRGFVQDFFTQLQSGSFDVEDLEQVPGYADLDGPTKTFLTALVVGLAQESITIQEAREAYIAQFPTDECD